MATLAIQNIVLAGLNPSYAAAAGGGDDFLNTGREYVEFVNASAGDITVTINSQKNCDQGFDHDQAVVVTASQRRKIGPFTPGRWNDPSDNKLKMTYSGVTSLTVGVFRL